MSYDAVKRAKDRETFIKSLDESDKDGKPKFTPEQKERQTELFDVTSLALEENAKRSGIGLRVFTGMTRGKGSNVISWEQFSDDSEPKSLKEFQEIVKPTEADALKYMIVGYNDSKYIEASDPIAEHVNENWEDSTVSQFRLVVRNMHKSLSVIGKSIDDVVAMVKPGFEQSDSQLKAAKK